MNKSDLIQQVRERARLTTHQSSQAVTAVIETIMEAVADGEKVLLTGFGSFEPRERKAREGYNPKTREAITIPPRRVPAFSAGKTFKELVADK